MPIAYMLWTVQRTTKRRPEDDCPGRRMTEPKTSDPLVRPRGEFANILLALRREFGLSQRHMALLAGVHELNSLNRSTKKGRKAGLNLTVFLDKKRVAVNGQNLR